MRIRKPRGHGEPEGLPGKKNHTVKAGVKNSDMFKGPVGNRDI